MVSKSWNLVLGDLCGHGRFISCRNSFSVVLTFLRDTYGMKQQINNNNLCPKVGKRTAARKKTKTAERRGPCSVGCYDTLLFVC